MASNPAHPDHDRADIALADAETAELLAADRELVQPARAGGQKVHCLGDTVARLPQGSRLPRVAAGQSGAKVACRDAQADLEQAPMRPRSDLTTRLRLASGLVLMVFVASHLANHALGIVSLAAMEQARTAFVAVWRSPPGTLLLYAALLGHIGLALHKLWRRRSLRMPAWEAAQITLGLLIPFWLTVHIIGTRGAHQWQGVDDDYAYLLNVLWPNGAWRQSLMLTLVWLHGCIGLHFWLRLRAWYPALRPWLFALALLLPALALIGFADAGREVRALAADPQLARDPCRDRPAGRSRPSAPGFIGPSAGC